jgi:transcriptional regulator GlxA family with amidase domain
MPTARSFVALFALSCTALLATPPPALAAAPSAARPIAPPAGRAIAVAFAISEGSNVIDMAGPWEVFQDVDVPGRGSAFRLFTVAATREPVRLTGGLRVIPDSTFSDAPTPDVVVVPAIRGSAELDAWLRRVEPEVDVLMSVCTGAFQLARAGLLDGRMATTHHDFWDDLANDFPKVKVVRGERWVEANDRIASAGGLTSGIDLALRVVERYFGRDVARRTATYMEYRGAAPD